MRLSGFSWRSPSRLPLHPAFFFWASMPRLPFDLAGTCSSCAACCSISSPCCTPSRSTSARPASLLSAGMRQAQRGGRATPRLLLLQRTAGPCACAWWLPRPEETASQPRCAAPPTRRGAPRPCSHQTGPTPSEDEDECSSFETLCAQSGAGPIAPGQDGAPTVA